MAELSYREQVDAQRIIRIREINRDLPPACGDFIRAIAVTTGTFTRLAYALDLRTFFHFLQSERVAFAQKPLYLFTDADLSSVSQSDLTAYVEYLTLYYKQDDTDGEDRPMKAMVNHELAIKRKLCSLRAFYDFLFMNNRVPSNVTQLVALPRVHEKPIIRLNQAEMTRMLTVAESGEKMTAQNLPTSAEPVFFSTPLMTLERRPSRSSSLSSCSRPSVNSVMESEAAGAFLPSFKTGSSLSFVPRNECPPVKSQMASSKFVLPWALLP